MTGKKRQTNNNNNKLSPRPKHGSELIYLERKGTNGWGASRQSRPCGAQRTPISSFPVPPSPVPSDHTHERARRHVVHKHTTVVLWHRGTIASQEEEPTEPYLLPCTLLLPPPPVCRIRTPPLAVVASTDAAAAAAPPTPPLSPVSGCGLLTKATTVGGGGAFNVLYQGRRCGYKA